MNKWEGKHVVVSGGSSGLGYQIARAFGLAGASLTLIARNQTHLEKANDRLKSEDIRSSYSVADVTDWKSVESAFSEILKNQNQIDVLINAVGKSTRSDIRDLDLTESRDLMDVNYFSALHCIKAALPQIESVNGHIVNIGSLSSKTAWPFMTPYTASKFALAALTHQIRLELGNKLHAMLVCPGPIKRDDAGSRYDEQSKDLPEEARKPGGGAKLKGVCPTKLAEMIMKGCENRKAEIIVPWKAKILFLAAAVSTRLGDWLLRKNKS